MTGDSPWDWTIDPDLVAALGPRVSNALLAHARRANDRRFVTREGLANLTRGELYAAREIGPGSVARIWEALGKAVPILRPEDV
jgi:hypothetical protein